MRKVQLNHLRLSGVTEKSYSEYVIHLKHFCYCCHKRKQKRPLISIIADDYLTEIQLERNNINEGFSLNVIIII